MEKETAETVPLDRSDFVGLDWVFDVDGSVERLLDLIDAGDGDARSQEAA